MPKYTPITEEFNGIILRAPIEIINNVFKKQNEEAEEDYGNSCVSKYSFIQR